MTSLLHINDEFITQTEINGIRHYEVMTQKFGKQKYPSVSTLVGKFQNKAGLQQWADRLGYDSLSDEEKQLPSEIISVLVKERGQQAANAVKNAAAKRGTNTHNLCEQYYKHNIISDDDCFQRLLPFLKICKPLAVETKVKWERQLPSGQMIGWAGRFDNISWVDFSCLYDSLGNSAATNNKSKSLCIVDYKTWDKPKYNISQSRDGKSYFPLLSYYLQLTAYLAAFNQCKYYDELVRDAILVGVTSTCKQAWIYHLNLHKINFLFEQLKLMALAYYKLGSYSWEDLEALIIPEEDKPPRYLGERLYLTPPKTPF